MQTGLTRALAQRALTTRTETLPDQIKMLARQCVLDTLGVAVAGADDPLVRILHAELAEQGGNGVATIWGSTEKLPVLSAALLNGTIAHALDYDDVNMAMPGHPSVAILPAVLALAVFQAAEEAALVTLMADAGALRRHLEEHGIAVAIGGDLLDHQAVAGAFALEPQFAAGPAPEGGKTGFDGFVKGILVHVADHEDASAGMILDDGGDEAV